MTPGRARAIADRFAAAAGTYDEAATLQRLVATRLAARIAAEFRQTGTEAPRILEIGCGTGLLTRALRRQLPRAEIVATDVAPAMLSACRRSCAGDGRLRLLAMDGARPAVGAGFDLVCSSLALQWLPDLDAALRVWGDLLAPAGRLMLATLCDGSLAEWRAAHAGEGAADGGLPLPTLSRLRRIGRWDAETVVVPHADGLAFLRALRRIGAGQPAPGHRPLDPGRLRRVLRRFEDESGARATYEVAFGRIVRPARRGVFVTGTDTGIGKTLVAACLACAWDADYWKPLQTGLADEPADSDTVRRLAGLDAARIHPPAVRLQASLSPEDAARLEAVAIETDRLALPPGDRPLVVEGAGGVLVPIAPGLLMIDLVARLALPVVLVARSTLGTLNHTLLSLEALRARGIPVAGVILNGPPSPGNRAAIERHGGVRVLAELPPLPPPDVETVARLADQMPALATIEAAVRSSVIQSASDAPDRKPKRA